MENMSFDFKRNLRQGNRGEDYFEKFKGTKIELVTKFIDKGEYFVFSGILDGRSNDYIYLRDGEIIKCLLNGEEVKECSFSKIAVNKGIVSYINFP